MNKRYICYALKYNTDSSAILSRDGEEFEKFKDRIYNIYPILEGWYCHFSEWKEIY